MRKVLLSIRGQQAYMGQEPDVIELVTEGILTKSDGAWELQYEETELTGLAGVTTIFRVEDERIVLTRTGKLHSQMVFQEGVTHDSLYQTEFGAMMLSVCASKISHNLSDNGGVIDMSYRIELEQSAAGVIDYHLEIKPK